MGWRAGLLVPGRERVPQVMPAEILNPAAFEGGVLALVDTLTTG